MTALARLARLAHLVRRDLVAVVPAWILARVLVALAWVVARVVADDTGDVVRQWRNGLFAWDAGWYRDIADYWYTGMPPGAIRFFPLFPLIGRAIPGAEAVVLVTVTNVGALVAAALLRYLVRTELGDEVVAQRAATLFTLFPAALVLVLAYAEALFVCLAVGVFIALRRQRWMAAAGLGLLATTCRPIGVLLVVPMAVELYRAGARPWRALAAPAGPVLGLVAVAMLAHDVTGSWTSPIDEQNTLRGDFVDPVSRVGRGLVDMVGAERFGDGLHTPFVLAALGLCVVAWRRLPASYALYSIVTVIVALSAENLNSFERYALNAFPLVIALALVTDRPRWRVPTAVASAVMMFAVAVAAFAGEYTP